MLAIKSDSPPVQLRKRNQDPLEYFKNDPTTIFLTGVGGFPGRCLLYGVAALNLTVEPHHVYSDLLALRWQWWWQFSH